MNSLHTNALCARLAFNKFALTAVQIMMSLCLAKLVAIQCKCAQYVEIGVVVVFMFILYNRHRNETELNVKCNFKGNFFIRLLFVYKIQVKCIWQIKQVVPMQKQQQNGHKHHQGEHNSRMMQTKPTMIRVNRNIEDHLSNRCMAKAILWPNNIKYFHRAISNWEKMHRLGNLVDSIGIRCVKKDSLNVWNEQEINLKNLIYSKIEWKFQKLG